MNLSVAIHTFSLKNGLVESLPSPGVVVLVGPNNAGKSLMLRELYLLMSSRGHPPAGRILLEDIDLRSDATGEELLLPARSSWASHLPDRDWIVHALEGNLHESPSSELRSFLTGIVKFAGSPAIEPRSGQTGQQ
jgi:ABC-type cobalamin/Fe3+-siderophores transport system ATPase subunit